MTGILRWLFHLLLVRPFVLVILGVNVRHAERLPGSGPAIIAANHNTHIDTFVLMTLFSMDQLLRIRAAAAADYFLGNRLLAWFAINMFGVIPVKRGNLRRGDGDPLAGCSQALARGEMLIVYPEGTRGEPERLGEFKSGIAHLARRHPTVPVVPVLLHGVGKVLPKGSIVPVPFNCDVMVGRSLRWNGDCRRFMQRVADEIRALADEGDFPPWTDRLPHQLSREGAFGCRFPAAGSTAYRAHPTSLAGATCRHAMGSATALLRRLDKRRIR